MSEMFFLVPAILIAVGTALSIYFGHRIGWKFGFNAGRLYEKEMQSGDRVI